MSEIFNEAEICVAGGGPVRRFTQRLTQSFGLNLTDRYRIVAFLVITWLPLLGFALIEGRAVTAVPRESLLLDFASYARFFLGVPLLILAEPVVGPRLAQAGLQFVRGGYVQPDDLPAFRAAVARVVRWRESGAVEWSLVALTLATSWFLRTETIHGLNETTWRSPLDASGSSVFLTGLWYLLVSLPILQFFFLRWLWRLLIWFGFLSTVSRLRLNLIATHADQAGGLGFLGTAHTTLGIFSLGMSAVLSSEAAFALVFASAKIESFRLPFIAFLVIVEILVFGPLLMFAPAMLRARLAALRDYGLLVVRYSRAFHEKWIGGGAGEQEPLLGSADIQSLADLGGSFEYIRNMKVVPFSVRMMLQLAVVTGLPCLPLLLIVMPVNTIIQLLVGALF